MTGVVVTRLPADASPVLIEWFAGWDEWCGRQDPDRLGPYIERLAGSRGTTDQEVVRQWLVIDWLVRRAVPVWLRAAGLAVEADLLRRAAPVMGGRALADAADPAVEAARAAADVHERAWTSVARLAQPDAPGAGGRPPWRPVPGDADPRRVRAWGGLAGGTRAAVPAARRLVEPACRAVGFGTAGSDEAPIAWRAATRAAVEAAGVVAWTATRTIVAASGWSWHTPADDAWHSAHAAAGTALRPVEATFVASADALVEEMLQVAEVDRWKR